MRPRSLWSRLFIVALALLQATAPMLASAAEGEYARTRIGAADETHVEDHTQRNCAPAHPDSCALCQFLANATPDTPAQAFVPVCDGGRVAHVREASSLPAQLARAQRHSRAPPIA
jgi:hypothetical protein